MPRQTQTQTRSGKPSASAPKNAATSVDQQAKARDLADAFRVFDLDRDGFITEEELGTILLRKTGSELKDERCPASNPRSSSCSPIPVFVFHASSPLAYSLVALMLTACSNLELAA